MVEIKLQANESLAATIGNDGLIYFEPYSPTPLELMSCLEECPCAFPDDPVCGCDLQMECGGTIPLDLSSGNKLSFHWEASRNDDKFISITGNKRTRVEFRAHIVDCKAPYQDILGNDINFELDDAGLDASQKYTYSAESSFLSLGTCDGCAQECDIFTRIQFDPDTNGVLDLKFKSLTFSANYDPQQVTQGNAYEWSTDSYIWIRQPEGGVIELLQAPNKLPTKSPSSEPTSPTEMPVTEEPSTGATNTVYPTSSPTKARTQLYTDKECTSWIASLIASDVDSSMGISESEFPSFLSSIEDPLYASEYFEQYEDFDNLPWVFRVVHKSLTCHCEKFGLGGECCEGDNAEVLLMGLENSINKAEEEYKELFCQQIAYVLTKSVPSPAPTVRPITSGISVPLIPTQSCPDVLGKSTEIDASAILQYAIVPSNPPGSGNGLLCGRLEAEHDGWIALAISKDGFMIGTGSEAIIGVPSDNTVLKYDMTAKATSGVTAMVDDKQTLTDTSIAQEGGKTIMKFTKLLVEDGEIPILEEGVNIFLHARGGSSLGYHSMKLSFEKDFGTPNPTPILTPIPTFHPISSSPSKTTTMAPTIQKTPTSSPAPSINLRYCGLSLENAQNLCANSIPCPDGRNDNCLRGQTCFSVQRICDTTGSATNPGIFSPSTSPTNTPMIQTTLTNASGEDAPTESPTKKPTNKPILQISPSTSPTNTPTTTPKIQTTPTNEGGEGTHTESPAKEPTNKPILQIPYWDYDPETADDVGEVDGMQNYSSTSLHSYSMAVVLGTIAVGGTLYVFM